MLWISFFQIFLDTRSDLCYNRPGTELFQARGGARKTLLLHLAFALAQMRTSFYHFTTLLGAQRAFAQKSGRGYPSKLIDEKNLGLETMHWFTQIVTTILGVYSRPKKVALRCPAIFDIISVWVHLSAYWLQGVLGLSSRKVDKSVLSFRFKRWSRCLAFLS